MHPSRTTGSRSAAVRRANVPQCPLRYGEPCTLCQAFVTGPEDCQTVALVMEDPELKAQWAKGRAAWAREQRLAKQAALRAYSSGLITGTPRSW